MSVDDGYADPRNRIAWIREWCDCADYATAVMVAKRLAGEFERLDPPALAEIPDTVWTELLTWARLPDDQLEERLKTLYGRPTRPRSLREALIIDVDAMRHRHSLAHRQYWASRSTEGAS